MRTNLTIEHTEFGSITIDGQSYHHDVVIRLDGEIEKRRKSLSKGLYGTSHIISLDEAKDLYQAGAARLVIGTGQIGLTRLSEEAEAFVRSNGCQIDARPTPDASSVWNEGGEGDIGLFHVTC